MSAAAAAALPEPEPRPEPVQPGPARVGVDRAEHAGAPTHAPGARNVPGDPDDVEGLRRALARARAKIERQARILHEAETIAEKGLSDLHRRGRQSAFLERVASLSNGSSSREEALWLAAAEICLQLDWTCALSYIVAGTGPHGPILRATECQHALVPGLDRFLRDAATSGAPSATTLPGRVAATGWAAWDADLAADPFFVRQDSARACGIISGAAFPVTIGDRVIAVIEVFSQRRVPEDGEMMATMIQAGSHVARVFERAATSERLLRDATRDALTGLVNRTRMAALLAEADASGVPHHVAFIDLDRFKWVNDSLGHEAGDTFLREIARRFSRACRTSCSGTLARMGGDEFVVLMESGIDEAEAERRASALLACLDEPVEVAGVALRTSASIGVASSLHGAAAGGAGPSALLRAADAAMYQAKSSGRNQVRVFDGAMRTRIGERLAVEQRLREALAAGSLRLHYQPVVDGERRVRGYEALIRMVGPGGALIAPDAFVAVAEEVGLIVPIGSWVIGEASAACVRINAARAARGDGPVRVAVNVSSRQMHHPGLVATVAAALAASGCPPELLKIEITESSAVEDYESTAHTLKALAKLGVGARLDDFGTGHSSLGHLHRLPFEAVKIDRSFAADIDGHGRQIVEAVVTMARSFGMKVIVEGVEDEATLERLQALGCDLFQGYLFSKPTAEADLWIG